MEVVGARGEDGDLVSDGEGVGGPGDLGEVGGQGELVACSGEFGVEVVDRVRKWGEGFEGESGEWFGGREGEGVRFAVVG